MGAARVQVGMWVRLALAVLSVLVVSGCRVPQWMDPGSTLTDPEQVGSMLTLWYQGEPEDEVILQELDAVELPILMRSDTDREAFLKRLSRVTLEPDDLAAIRGVDLDLNVLVVGRYGDCAAESAVEFDDTVLRFTVTREENVNCGWTPTKVEIWQVPLAELAGAQAEDLSVE